jgi:hypothetical protein
MQCYQKILLIAPVVTVIDFDICLGFDDPRSKEVV